MSNDYHRLAFHQLGKSLLHAVFVLRVGKGCSLIKHQYRSILQYGTSHADTLRLAAGEIDAIVTDARLIALVAGG